MATIIVNGWELVSKRKIGKRGYVFHARNANFAGLAANSVKLVVNVVEEGAQRIFLRQQEPIECGQDASQNTWEGFALITPVENEALHEVTGDWDPSKSATIDFAIQFEVVSIDENASVVFGKLPKVVTTPKPGLAPC